MGIQGKTVQKLPLISIVFQLKERHLFVTRPKQEIMNCLRSFEIMIEKKNIVLGP